MAWLFHQVVVPIFVIGVLVIVHELGHFVLAKLCKVGVVKFAIGFGPALYRFRRKETTYQLGLIPFGGFVRMVGDIPDMLTGEQLTDESVRGEEDRRKPKETTPPELQLALDDRSRWFIEKNFWQRSAIVVAGPLFNYLSAIVVVAFAVFFYGSVELSDEARIGEVMAGSPAKEAGLIAGDLVLAIDQQAVDNWGELAETVHQGTGAPIKLHVRREAQELDLIVQPKQKDLQLSTGDTKQVYLIGIEPTTNHIPVGLGRAWRDGLLWTFDKTLLTYAGLWGMITGKVSPKDLAGPLFIIDAAGKQSRQGLDSLLYFVALLSVSLAVLNLLPIPILDGGHLLFFLIEAIIGPMSMRKKEMAQQVGMLLLISLMVFAIHNDIFRDRSALKKGTSFDDLGRAPDNAQPAATPSAKQDSAQPAAGDE
jgi:regulator of sigma E protease